MKKKLFAALMAATLALGVALPAAAAPLQSTDPSADGYVSLHQYVSPTADPTIYKVTHTILAKIKMPALFLTFVLDTSGSMWTYGNILDATTSNLGMTRRMGVARALRAAMKELETKKDYIDVENTYVNIISETGTTGYSFTENHIATMGSISGTGFIPFFSPDGTTINADVEASIAAYESYGASSDMEAGFKKAYQDLDTALDSASKGIGFSGSPARMTQKVNIKDASKFIMVLGDGDVFGNAGNALQWLAAAKLPMDLNSSDQMETESSPIISGANHALGATVWTSVWGHDGAHLKPTPAANPVVVSRLTYTSDYQSGSNSTPGQYSGGLAGNGGWGYSSLNYQFVEPFMILAANPVNRGDISSYSSLTGTAAASAVADYFTKFTSVPSISSSNYYWVQHAGSTTDQYLTVSAADATTLITDGGVTPVPSSTTTGGHQNPMTKGQIADFGSSDGVYVFKNFVSEATNLGTPVANGTMSQGFTITKVAGKPLYELGAADGGSPGTASVTSDSNIVWKPALRPNVEFSLSYYVKVDTSLLSSDSFYDVCSMVLTTKDGSMTFPQTYINPQSSETKVEESKETAATTTKETKKTTTELLPIVGGQGTLLSRAVPEINGVSSKKLTNGRTQVTCDVKNGSDFFYQWQYKDTADKWIDITGANSSTYTLGRPLVVGKTYELRCVVSNSRGTKVISEVIKATYTKSAVSSESLVTAK